MSEELPNAYMLAKLKMVMPLFQEARDALTAIRETQRVLHGISATLADRMDDAGTFSLEDWNRRAPAQPEPAAPTVACITECEACFTPDACQLRGKCDHYTAEQLRVCKSAAPTVVEPVDDVAYHELTDAECDEFRRHHGDFNSMLRSVHSDGHYRHAGRLITHLGSVFNERLDRAIAATPPRAALTDEPEVPIWTGGMAYHMGRGVYECSVLPACGKDIKAFEQLTPLQQAEWVAKAAMRAVIAADRGQG